MEFNPDRKQYIKLTQPTDNQLVYLDEVTGGEYLINSAELALDLETDSDLHSEILQDWFTKHLIQSHHGNKEVSTFEHSTYYAARAQERKTDGKCKVTRRNIDLYTRHSKDFSGVPALSNRIPTEWYRCC